MVKTQQKRDKHGENSTKRLVFLQVPLAGSKLWHRSSVMVHMNDLLTQPIAQVRKQHFLSHLYIKVIFLPRQARDKHREKQFLVLKP